MAKANPDGYVVDPFSAEQLAKVHDEFTSVQVRECLEWHRVPQAIQLLARFGKEAEPYRELKHWALVNEAGFYTSRKQRPGAREEYERYLHYLSVKDSEHRAKRGTGLTVSQQDDLTRKFYAPAFRAEMARLSSESWKEFHRTLDEEPPAVEVG